MHLGLEAPSWVVSPFFLPSQENLEGPLHAALDREELELLEDVLIFQNILKSRSIKSDSFVHLLSIKFGEK
jgi:hypothetical protein